MVVVRGSGLALALALVVATGGCRAAGQDCSAVGALTGVDVRVPGALYVRTGTLEVQVCDATG